MIQKFGTPVSRQTVWNSPSGVRPQMGLRRFTTSSPHMLLMIGWGPAKLHNNERCVSYNAQ